MSEFWIEKCDNPKCGFERRIQANVPTIDPEAEHWIHVRLGSGPGILCFCRTCAAPMRAELEKLRPELAHFDLPDSDADRGPVQ